MPDHSRPITLDLHLEQALAGHIEHDMQLGRFQLSEGRTFVLDPGSGDAGRSSTFRQLKEKLDPYIDFEAGGLKVLQVHVAGRPANFTLVPRWQLPPSGVKGIGGPSIALQFTMHW